MKPEDGDDVRGSKTGQAPHSAGLVQNHCVAHYLRREHLLLRQRRRQVVFPCARQPFPATVACHEVPGREIRLLARVRLSQANERRPWNNDTRPHLLRQPLEDEEAQNKPTLFDTRVLARCFGPSPARPQVMQMTGREWLAPFSRAPIWATTTPEIACSN
jgi:hypothetical protein